MNHAWWRTMPGTPRAPLAEEIPIATAIQHAASDASNSPLYRHVVADAKRALSIAEIAEITGVGDRAVQKWAQGATKPEGSSRERLLELKYVIEQLSDVYDDEGVEIWLHARQRAFGGRPPLEVLREGRFEEVLQVIERLAGGPRR